MDFCSKYWGCHQMPERSFFIGRYQLPVCARCTGIIIGYIAAIVISIFDINIKSIICLLFILPIAIDGTIQYLTKYESNNIKRLLTGFLSGLGFITLIMNFVKFLLHVI